MAAKRSGKKSGAAKSGGAAKRGGAKKSGAKKSGAKRGGAVEGATRGIGSVLSNIGSIAGTVGSIAGGGRRAELRVSASRNAGINDIISAVRKKFREAGCPTCRSGIDRIILEDVLAGGGGR